MSEILVIAGDKGNIIEDAGSIVATSENALCPASNLALTRPARPFCFDAAAEDDSITIDLAPDINGDMETETLDGWNDGSVGASNAISDEETIKNGGDHAMKLTLATAGAGNMACGYRDVEVRSGYQYSITAALRGDGTVSARLRVLCRETGLYLQDDGSWSTVADVFARATASYATPTPVVFTMPSFATTLRAKLTIRIMLVAAEASNTGVAYVDDVAIWPSWDIASFHGLELGPVVLQVRRSEDGFSADDQLEGTPTIYAPTMYYRAASLITDRYLRALFVGTNHEAIELGALFVGQALSLQSRPNFEYEPKFASASVVQETPGGESIVTMDPQRWPRRSLMLTLDHDSIAAAEESLAEIFLRAEGPAQTVWIVPDGDLVDALHRPLLGRTGRTWAVRRRSVDTWQGNEIAIAELPFRARDPI